MKNTTNWHLYTSHKTDSKPPKGDKIQVTTKEIQNKIQLIKKAFR